MKSIKKIDESHVKCVKGTAFWLETYFTNCRHTGRPIMKYYISKPNSHKTDENIISGIQKIDAEAVFVDALAHADICVFQKGWTKSNMDRYVRNNKVFISAHLICTKKQ